MGDNAISVKKYDIYEVKNCGKGVTRELWIVRMNWHETYRLYSYPAWRDILRGWSDKLSASKPGPAWSVHFRRLWDTPNLRGTSPSSKHFKKYHATRPMAGDKLGGVPLQYYRVFSEFVCKLFAVINKIWNYIISFYSEISDCTFDLWLSSMPQYSDNFVKVLMKVYIWQYNVALTH